MNKFRVGQFDIDVKRCKISSTDSQIVVEPKIIDVLQFLYSQKGKVVSQEEIFSAVWPNSTFNPSSVQRCIALLRKALKEDSKNPQLIITHPKRGYCLECTVIENERGIVKSFTGRSVTLAAAITICIVITMISFVRAWHTSKDTSIKTDFSRLVPITSNEANESYLSVSPNGEYLAFIRGDNDKQHIWLKELNTGREVRVTDEPANYGSLGWSPDNRALAFIQNDNEQQSLGYFNLDLVNFHAVGYIQVIEFNEYSVTSHRLQWAGSNLIYFIEKNKETNETRLSVVDLKTKFKQVIIASQGQDWLLVHALSPDKERIALGYEMGQNQYRVDLLNLSNAKSETLLVIEDGIQGLSWHPDGTHLLISKRDNLLTVDLQGQLSRINFDNFQVIRDATFTPSGQEILMELVNIDVDIISSTRTDPDKFTTLVDTASIDFLPVFSPDSSKFAFESHRYGSRQLFLYDKGQQSMVFSNPNNEELFGIVWSKSGEEIITASKDKLFRINLANGDFEVIPHPHHSFYLQETFQYEEAILVSYRAADGTSFHPAKLDLNTLGLTTYTGTGERLVCYSMDLDEHDQVYFSNDKQVFRLNHNADIEEVWQTGDQHISGVSINNNNLVLKLDQDEKYEIVNINLLDGTSDVLFTGNDKHKMLINASHDYKEFLYLTEPKRKKTLVRLQ
ncbi:WD40-like Beta Propeller Repeat [Shewanella morhuae]|uniref:winged helix-turn-helix domain-containing protein n=1 Tax=Shewanella morhuae TaxID=365591 RepID=UPI000953C9D8|nr:winged helix-turn-helix domain-containing protein [Shewanella morhuae]SIR32163.1 WD40-like Beta Propeller Repeat [Shewanella morhuae]